MTLADAPEMLRPHEARRALPEDARVSAFVRDGCLGPVRIFTPLACRRIAAYLRRADRPPPPAWDKARAVRERVLFDLALQPAIMAVVTALLGDDVVLWGVSAVSRSPGVTHPWHSDIESCAPDGGFLTAWIGIEQTSAASGLQLIARSHLLGETVQQCRVARGLRREAVTPEAMLAVARERDPLASLLTPAVTDGDAIFFDGRLWHGSHNRRAHGRRLALLLQYAAADRPVRIPDLNQLDWPFRVYREPRPSVILVSGTARGDANRLVPPPPPRASGLPMISTAVNSFALPSESPPGGWQMFPAFHGPTATLDDMSCHASLLAPGHAPHPPHAHREEELLIPLRGEVELQVAAGPTDPAPRVERLAPGGFAYYPAGQFHTIRNPGPDAAAYVMFKWYAPPPQAPRTAQRPLATTIHRPVDGSPATGRGFQTETVLEGATSALGMLHAHATTLQPGAGYAPHVDAYDVAIVTLAGTVETLGHVVDPLSVVYYAAGESHGMRNVGADTARYLVFELHAGGTRAIAPRDSVHRLLARSVVRAGRRLVRIVRDRVGTG